MGAPTVPKVIDTTGAGDAFLGGLVIGIKANGMPQNEDQLRYCRFALSLHHKNEKRECACTSYNNVSYKIVSQNHVCAFLLLVFGAKTFQGETPLY